jgi:hypothetical protein
MVTAARSLRMCKVLALIVCRIVVGAIFSVAIVLLSPPSRGGFALRHHHVILKIGSAVSDTVAPALAHLTALVCCH